MAAAEEQRLCRRLQVEFSQPQLLRQALRHKSAGIDNNERLEFLGDAVLGLVVADALFARYPEAHEDGLSLMRAALVRRDSLAEIARELELQTLLELGVGERSSGGRERASILADAFEAVIGAVFLDQGFVSAEALVLRLFETRLATVTVTKDAKTRLQEWLQARHLALPEYSVDSVSGPDHSRRFKVQCALADGSRRAFGEASSRRAAEQAAAGELLVALGESP